MERSKLKRFRALVRVSLGLAVVVFLVNTFNFRWTSDSAKLNLSFDTKADARSSGGRLVD